MILAGGRVDELSVLTIKRPKSALPFGGMYRIIDFPLTNLMRSGIDRVGILSQYRLTSLMDHVGTGAPWDFSGRRRGVRMLPPYMVAGRSEWYRGTADAVYQNLSYINHYQPDLVMVLSGDHIYRMDYGPMIKFHQEHQADLTIGFKQVELENISRFGIATLDPDGRVTSYEEKPKRPRSNLASLTIYLFQPEVLMERLMENASTGKTFQFYDEIIPRMVDENRVFGYTFDGYWHYSRTIDEYHRASMDLVAEPSPVDLGSWMVRTNPANSRLGDLPPARFLKGSSVQSSIISGGCVIEGEVSSSVLSPYAVVKKGARVSNSILMHDVVVNEDAVVEGAILDKFVQVGKGACVGSWKKGGRDSRDDSDRAGRRTSCPDGVPNREIPGSLASGVTVVGPEIHIPARLKVGRNCLIYPDVGSLPKSAIPDGTTVK